MSIKLRDLIRAVRACKTAAEERAVISKECALIRTAIKEEDEQFRHRNVAKLMFIHMLGYPTHFGQMECLKLISAQTFPEKRVGYLGLTLLLTEQTEVLTLVTNSMKLDLSNPNQYIAATSLISIGNLATQDMARDLASDVDKLLRSGNSYLRKKAALACIRLLKKEPDLIEHMGDRIVALLKDKSHGVLISGIQLMTDVLELIPSFKAEYVKLVPALVRLLRNFISLGFSPEHDVSGITDPFMQVKILRLLKMLGKDNEEASDQMNDVLAQVATGTETSKNAGNAILYECVQTIMEVQSDASLRVLAVNILGRFLLNRDNNIRYVALNSLSRVVSEDIAAVQRHRTTIVDCLKDPDISIRQRALELIYQLVNEQNVIVLTTELLNYLIVAQTEHKASLVSKVIQIVEKYSPSKKWKVDTVVTMLSIAGNITDESVPRTAIIFITQSAGLQAYAAHRLYRHLQEDSSQMGLLQVAIWCIGEYGAHLTTDCLTAADDTDTSGASSNAVSYSALSEVEVVQMLERASHLHNVDVACKALILNAYAKLTVRFTSATSKQMILDLIAPFQSSMSVELQQRSVEYTSLISSQSFDGLRHEILEQMPVLDEAELRRRRAIIEDGDGMGMGMGMENDGMDSPSLIGGGMGGMSDGGLGAMGTTPTVGGMSNAAPSLLDLDDIFGGGAPAGIMPTMPTMPAMPAPQTDQITSLFDTPPVSMQTSQYPPHSNGAGAMGGAMGSAMGMPGMYPNHNTSLPPAPAQFSPPTSGMDLLNLGMPAAPMVGSTPMGTPMGGMTAGMTATSPSSGHSIKAFDKAGLQIFMDISKPNSANPSASRILCRFVNFTSTPLYQLVFQAAVPKYLKLEMLPPSSTTIPANSNGAVTQEIKLVNSMQGSKNIMLKLKICYTVGVGGVNVEEMAQVSSFPPLF